MSCFEGLAVNLDSFIYAVGLVVTVSTTFLVVGFLLNC